ncbi:hypothetical protein HK100_004456 [Physocladia obscura]|uniref:Protein kinase domain-containing protein n=1 Tax=Physocladia obscura TaxID=109957 RepID=A0AAD5XKR3_9FUNG|nr:hypothetical protein HK100_004456 [Physocladia obscura]
MNSVVSAPNSTATTPTTLVQTAIATTTTARRSVSALSVQLRRAQPNNDQQFASVAGPNLPPRQSSNSNSENDSLNNNISNNYSNEPASTPPTPTQTPTASKHTFHASLPRRFVPVSRRGSTVQTVSTSPISAVSSPAASFLSLFSAASELTPNRGIYNNGDQIGEWFLKKEIGHGSFSRVFEAEHSEKQNKKAAIKIIRKPTQSTFTSRSNSFDTFTIAKQISTATLENYKHIPIVDDNKDNADTDANKVEKMMDKETRIWSCLKHPNILQILDVMEVDDALCIVSELAEGGTLLDFLGARGSNLSENTVAAMFRQLVNAVSYLHSEAGIVHRDLKLENVMILEDWKSTNENEWIPTLKVIDFGLSDYINNSDYDDHQDTAIIANSPSTSTSSLTSVGVGSLHYCSPEDLRGLSTGQTSESSDVWALGCVLYAMLTGSLPFNDGFLPRLQQTIINGKYDTSKLDRANRCKAVQSLMAGIFQVDVKKRLSVSDILNSEWMNRF